MKKDWNREMKNRAREIALSYTGPKRRVLMLPGWDGLCVREGLSNGLFDKNTGGVFVERDPLTHQHQLETLRPKFPHVTFVNGQLHDVDLTGAFDYGFLDFTSPLMPEVALWLPQFFDRLSRGGSVALTFAYATRNCIFGNALRDFFRNDAEGREYAYRTSIDTGVGDFKAVVYIAALQLLLNRHELRFDNFIKYHDHQPMLLFMVTKERHRATGTESALKRRLEQLCREHRKEVKVMAKTATSPAAQRAWATRRANKRKIAAKKAAATRRANAA